jgi:hypothetical protein
LGAPSPGRAASPVRHRAAAFVLAGVAFAAGAGAQVEIAPHDPLDFDRPEAWGMKYAAAVVAFTPLSPLSERPAGEVDLALEIASVPSLSAAERRIGFNGTKVEDIDRSPALGRLRATVALPRGFVAKLGVVPPVELDGLEPFFAAVALSRPLVTGRRFALAARGQAQYGTLEGDITCSRSDVAGGDDPVRNPLACEAPSRDELELVLFGGELVASYRPDGAARLEPYLVAAVQHLDGTFRVDARYSGLRDRTRLTADGWTWSLSLGASVRGAERWRLAGELAYSPLDIRRPGRRTEAEEVVNFRLAVARRLR